MAYQIPRNVKGEGRILFIFSMKGMIYTCVGAAIGLFIRWICKQIGITTVGTVIMLILAAIGFVIRNMQNAKFNSI